MPTELMPSAHHETRVAHAPRLAVPPRVAALALAGPSGAPARRAATNVALLAGAAVIAGSALIHLYLWADGYRHVTTIGPLFLAQGIAGLVLAALLVAYPRVATAAAGTGYLLATIGGFALSASVGLFGFQDTLDAPWAASALLIELAGVVCLVVGAALPLRTRARS
jgi:hypothetical protein